ncbi:single-stranded DNA-binding protein [Lacticigenium naphthae]|uniref:single-stranded DNA-binding protein n=1 Tax=Lacticigenium naphthae TaxID=515351 RepID=UPI000411BA39|nr:single-stranded DNA-binding protein [Lacticigenium naphthae]
MNKTCVIGRIVREVDIKDIGDNHQVLNNTIAVQRLYKTNGEDQADFIPFTAWNKTAELISAHCSKGDLIGLTGRMQSRSYTNKTEEKVYVIEMAVEEIQFLQTKKEKQALVF